MNLGSGALLTMLIWLWLLRAGLWIISGAAGAAREALNTVLL
jgi:hypothetical protein